MNFPRTALSAALMLATPTVFAQEPATTAASGTSVASTPAASTPAASTPAASTISPGTSHTLDRVEVSGIRDRLQLDAPAPTASRLGLSARETPATVQTLTQEDLQFKGLRTARETFADIPGAIAGNVPGNPAVVMMRGFSGNAVSILQDGVRVSTSTVVQRDTNTWHFDRIEVIKGPASVLHGEGALAGAINKVTRKPALDGTYVDALLSGGSFNTSTIAFGANVQMNEQLAVRMDVSQLQSDSLYDVDNNHTRARGLTGSVLFKPTERLSILVAVDHYADRYDSTYQGVPLVQASVAKDPSGILQSANGLVIDKALRHRNYNPDGAYSNAEETTLRSRLDGALGGGWTWNADLTAYTANRAFVLSDTQTFVAPTASFPGGSFNRTLQRFYHDHQFWNARTAIANDTTLAGLRNRFTVGVEYNHTDFSSLRQSAPSSAVAAVDPWHPVVGSFPTGSSVYTAGNLNYDSVLQTRSVFAEDGLKLAPEWLLVAGLRYDDIDLSRTVTNYNASTDPAQVGAVQSARPQYHPLSWRLGSTYDLSRTLTLYAQATSAAVPVSSMLLQSIANTSFKLTQGRSAEAGFKATALDHRLSLTGAVFYIRQTNILTRDPADASLTVQGGRQSSRGLELNAVAVLTPALSLGAGLGYVDAKYDKLIEAGGAVRTGHRPINTPTSTANAFASYAVPGTPLTLSGFVHYAAGFYTDTANSIHVDGHTTLDASMAWKTSRDTTLTLRGRNLTNAFYGEYSGYPTTNVYLGAPRSVEVSWLARF
ncbi:iron complex outermembrane recepter protein [Roseateles sp. YR242]|uniref:TonB-dependent receptor n=1 Tax=Roseateles sp. YR242 TaxID=1855305 RepID=UPI0008C2A232|nr:TonB-dependent siderophore receptor [Roseateles sp. YR242]SEL11420.1 iron complex outermembrane recepter protein [Roseateles sp. YR242]